MFASGISLVAGLFLKPLKLKSDGRTDRQPGCSRKCSDYILSKDLFTDVVFYLVVLIFFLDQTGRNGPVDVFTCTRHVFV